MSVHRSQISGAAAGASPANHARVLLLYSHYLALRALEVPYPGSDLVHGSVGQEPPAGADAGQR